MSVKILQGDCREILSTLPDESVNCVVTSPPYFGLRDYGVDGQIGLEATPDAFVAELVSVFHQVRHVLRADGTCWLNLGDTYAGGGNGGGGAFAAERANWRVIPERSGQRQAVAGLKSKDLVGIPWRVAFALQADGWYLRQDIIWSKPNPMPESVKDRCTKAHEYVFLLSKGPRYYYDADAIAEPLSDVSLARLSQDIDGQEGSLRGNGGAKTNGAMKAVRSRPQAARAHQLAKERGLTEEHIAAIRAVGIADTGKALVVTHGAGRNTEEVKRLAAEAKVALGGYYREFLTADTRNARSVWDIATQPFSEAHFATFPPDLAERCIKAGCPEGGTVLDPFFGAGTTGLVADRLKRNCIGIELNPAYAEIARRRIEKDAGMFADISSQAESPGYPGAEAMEVVRE